MKNTNEINDFWDWFLSNQHKYLFLDEVTEVEKEILLSEFLDKLHLYNVNVYFEIGEDIEGLKEIIITANGNQEYFENVEALVKQAPEINGWKVTAFKPALNPGFTITYNNISFSPKSIIFIPLENPEYPGKFGLQICYYNYDENTKDTFQNVSYLLLDAILGEKIFSQDVVFVKSTAVPENISEFTFYHLDYLAEYIKLKKSN